MSTHKKIVYDAFMSEMAEDAMTDIFVYNSDFDFLKRLLKDVPQQYDYFVVFPHFKNFNQL